MKHISHWFLEVHEDAAAVGKCVEVVCLCQVHCRRLAVIAREQTDLKVRVGVGDGSHSFCWTDLRPPSNTNLRGRCVGRSKREGQCDVVPLVQPGAKVAYARSKINGRRLGGWKGVSTHEQSWTIAVSWRACSGV